jgi:hypothetical protein
LLRAADRVRVRVLIDDGGTLAGDGRSSLNAHRLSRSDLQPSVSWTSRSRDLEPMFNHRGRLSNAQQLLVADNAVALVGIATSAISTSRWIRILPADDDVFAAGPIATQLSASFDGSGTRAGHPGGGTRARDRRTTIWLLFECARTPSAGPLLVTLRRTARLCAEVATEPYTGMISGGAARRARASRATARQEERRERRGQSFSGNQPVVKAAGAALRS